MNPMNFGQGNQILGGDANSALNEAIARRQQGQAGATSQVSPAAATGANQVPPNPQVSGSPSMPQPQGMGGQPQGMPVGAPESELIIKALDSRLKSLSKIQGA